LVTGFWFLRRHDGPISILSEGYPYTYTSTYTMPSFLVYVDAYRFAVNVYGLPALAARRVG